MSKNPFINALSASAYILIVVSVMNFLSKTLGSKPDSVFAPVLFLSMLTLSVSVMAYLFLYQPIQFLIDGKKKDALHLFVRTVGTFAFFTIILLALLLTEII